MLKNFKLIIEYDGSAYCGWQRQKSDRTIQGEIEAALKVMTKSPVALIGAGRTDAGTHARGQVANFRIHTRLTPEIFQKGLNSLLSDDIVIRSCTNADPTFHARFDVKSKTYAYRILNRSLPAAIGRQYAWFIREPLDLAAMRRALTHIVGSHDFRSFEGAGSPRSHSVRQVFSARLSEENHGYVIFRIEANGFLRYMVRNIVGTLVLVGRGKLAPEDFRTILETRNRDMAGPTAPSLGLFLEKICY